MSNIHRYPVPCLFNIQSPLWPVHGCRIDQLTFFTFSDNGFHSGLRNPRGNLSHKIKCPPHTRMTALSILICSSPTELTYAGQAECTGPVFLLIASSQLWGTLVNRSALFWLDLTKDIFIDSAYSFNSFIIVPSRSRMCISLAALVHTLALPVRVSEIHLWTQAKSVNKCMAVVFQRIAKFIPLIITSSSVGLIRWESFSRRNQQASSTIAPSYTSDSPVARELASTHTLRAWPSTHHLPRDESSLYTRVITSLIMVLRGASSILSSYPAVTSDTLRLMNSTATRSQPPIGRCPTNLLQSENMFRRMTTRGMSGILFPLLQYRELSSPQTCNPSSWAPSCCLSGSLLRTPKL